MSGAAQSVRSRRPCCSCTAVVLHSADVRGGRVCACAAAPCVRACACAYIGSYLGSLQARLVEEVRHNKAHLLTSLPVHWPGATLI